MKKSELRKLIVEYNDIKRKLDKAHNRKQAKRLEEIKHKYYHETGEKLEINFK